LGSHRRDAGHAFLFQRTDDFSREVLSFLR
jgi:hypothetical protein